MSRATRFEVAADEGGLRLDQVVPKHVAGLSRRKARTVIDLGGVFVDKTRVKVAGRLVRPGQVIEVTIGGALTQALDAVDSRADGEPGAGGLTPRIEYIDDHVIIADKPAGLVTAPTPESDRGDLLDQLSRAYGEVYLVHRIDLPTSGLLVFARTRDANKILGDAFVRHDIDREYRAVAIGRVAAQTIDRPIGARRAVTHATPIEVFEPGSDGDPAATLLAVRLETGRTHQIRIHLAGLGCPIAGDHQHGGNTERTFIPKCPRLALHAAVLGFTHPATGARVRFESSMPDELARWIDRLRARSATS